MTKPLKAPNTIPKGRRKAASKEGEEVKPATENIMVELAAAVASQDAAPEPARAAPSTLLQSVKDDFRNFLVVVWRHLGLPAPTPVQYAIAEWLQHGPRRRMIRAFRGVGKSFITSAYVCWLLLRNPDHKILVVSASKDRADNFTTFVLRLISEIVILQHLSPSRGQRCSKIAFDVGPARADHSPSVKSVGIFGQLTGTRADTIVSDDVEVPTNSATQVMRDKLAEAVKEFDAIVKPGAEIVYLGTPQTEQSLYNRLPDRGYSVRVWPARLPDERQAKNYGHQLAPDVLEQMSTEKAGSPLDPRRFDDTDLMEREASYGRSGFSLQFMLDTRLSDADRYPLKVSDLVVMSVNPEMAPSRVIWATEPKLALDDLMNLALSGDRFYRPMHVEEPWMPYTGAVMAIDPAGRGKDETGFAVVKCLLAMLFCPAVGAVKGYGDQSLATLALTAKRHAVKLILVESNFGDGMFTKLLQAELKRQDYPCTVEEERSKGQKELRIIDTLEPVLNSHRLVLDPQVIRRDYDSVLSLGVENPYQFSLIHQMTRLTRDRGSLAHDDRIEALAMAVGYWVEAMAKDADQARTAALGRLRDRELEKIMRNLLGPNGATRPSWFAGSAHMKR